MSDIHERDTEPKTPTRRRSNRSFPDQTTPKARKVFKPSSSSFKQNVIDRLNIDCAKRGIGIIIRQPPSSNMGYAGVYRTYEWKQEDVHKYLEDGILPEDEETMDQQARVRPFWLFRVPEKCTDIQSYEFNLERVPSLAAAKGFCLFVAVDESEKVAGESPRVWTAMTDALRFTPTEAGKGRFSFPRNENPIEERVLFVRNRFL